MKKMKRAREMERERARLDMMKATKEKLLLSSLCNASAVCRSILLSQPPLRFGWLPVTLLRLATAGSSLVSSQDPAHGKNLPCQLWINIYTADSMHQYIWIDLV